MKYCVLMEFIWTDIKGEGSVFQMLSNCGFSEEGLDFSAVTILEANENLVSYVPYSVCVGSHGVLYRLRLIFVAFKRPSSLKSSDTSEYMSKIGCGFNPVVVFSIQK